jgi:hypothetical protein
MKKLFTLLASLITITACASQGLQDLKPMVVKGKEWRQGFSYQVVSDFMGLKGLGLNSWTLTNDQLLKKNFLGGGVVYQLSKPTDKMDLALTAGWSADFSDFRHVTNGDWAVGLVFGFRF